MRTPGRRKVFVIGAPHHSGGFHLRSGVAGIGAGLYLPARQSSKFLYAASSAVATETLRSRFANSLRI